MKQCPVCGVYSLEGRNICPGCGESFASDHLDLREQVSLTLEGVGARRLLVIWAKGVRRHIAFLIVPLALTLLTIVFAGLIAALSNQPATKLMASLLNAEALIPFSSAYRSVFSTPATEALLILLVLFLFIAFTFWSVAILNTASPGGVSLRKVMSQTLADLKRSIPAALLLMIFLAVLWFALYFALFAPISYLLYRFPEFSHVAPLGWIFVTEMPALYVLFRCSTTVMFAVSERGGPRTSIGSAWAAAASRIGTILILALLSFFPLFLVAVWDAATQAQLVLGTRDTLRFMATTGLALFATFTFAALPAVYVSIIVLRKKLN